MFALCDVTEAQHPQLSSTNYLAPVAHRNRIEIMTAPTSGVSGMGIEIGAGLSRTRTGSDFITIPTSTTKKYCFGQNSLWVPHDVAPQPRSTSHCSSAFFCG